MKEEIIQETENIGETITEIVLITKEITQTQEESEIKEKILIAETEIIQEIIQTIEEITQIRQIILTTENEIIIPTEITTTTTTTAANTEKRISPDRKRSYDRERDSRRQKRCRSATPDSTTAYPLEQRSRTVNCWDIEPPGFHSLTAEQVKGTDLFLPSWAIVGKPHTQGMPDLTKAAMFTLKLPIQPSKESAELEKFDFFCSISNSHPSQYA